MQPPPEESGLHPVRRPWRLHCLRQHRGGTAGAPGRRRGMRPLPRPRPPARRHFWRRCAHAAAETAGATACRRPAAGAVRPATPPSTSRGRLRAPRRGPPQRGRPRRTPVGAAAVGGACLRRAGGAARPAMPPSTLNGHSRAPRWASPRRGRPKRTPALTAAVASACPRRVGGAARPAALHVGWKASWRLSFHGAVFWTAPRQRTGRPGVPRPAGATSARTAAASTAVPPAASAGTTPRRFPSLSQHGTSPSRAVRSRRGSSCSWRRSEWLPERSFAS
mmetsp:Transcript_64776/g.200564  ORF Transcript_64776/g.200564 Transcript_64776/m.200564 type:complete len:278 (+) Transcript_64776:140-973(+)